MKNDQKTPGFITLPNGDVIRADTIYAVRPADELPVDEFRKEPIPTRVIVDWGIPADEHDRQFMRPNCTVLDCTSDARRDELVAEIMRQIKIALAEFHHPSGGTVRELFQEVGLESKE